MNLQEQIAKNLKGVRGKFPLRLGENSDKGLKIIVEPQEGVRLLLKSERPRIRD